MEIRDATPQDAKAACEVLRQSISQLCEADHNNDPVILKPGSSLLIAAEAGAILAVGSITDAGEITLNYVSPVARFRGVSRAMLKAMEARCAARGATTCTLFSTETAHRFYQSAGYVDAALPSRKSGTSNGYPMFRNITD